MGLEDRRRFVLEGVGEAGLKVLTGAGIDVAGAVTRILVEQDASRERLRQATAVPSVENQMTSELAYRSADLDDVFGREYVRRMSLLGLPEGVIRFLYHQEKIIAHSGSIEERQAPWVRRYFLTEASTPENLPAQESLTLSELVLITDDANAAACRDHRLLDGLPDLRAAVCIAACVRGGSARYVYAFRDRVAANGWSDKQVGFYERNECLLTERFKWDMNQNPAWVENP